jgi:hypothetical protein
LWSQSLPCCLRCGQEGSRPCTTRIDVRRRCRRGGGDGGAGATSRLPSGRRRPASWGEPRTAAEAGEQGRRGPTTRRMKAALRGPSAEIRARAGASRGSGGRAAACGRQPAVGARVFARSGAALLRVCVCACDAVCVRAALCDVCVRGGLASPLGFTAVYFFIFLFFYS